MAKQTGRNIVTIRYYENIGIDEIRSLLDLVDRNSRTCAEVQRRTIPHLAEDRAKIADLQCIEQVLATTLVQCSSDNVPECPMLEALTT